MYAKNKPLPLTVGGLFLLCIKHVYYVNILHKMCIYRKFSILLLT